VKCWLPLRQSGFTLLELIVVMVLIGITASFSVPQLGGFLVADQMKTTMRRLVGIVYQTSELARRGQVAYLLRYKAVENRFEAIPETMAAGAEQKEKDKTLSLSVPESVMVGQIWSWYGGVQGNDEGSIRFSPQGYIEPTVLYLQRDDGHEMSLVLSPFLATVRVLDSHVVPDASLFAQ